MASSSSSSLHVLFFSYLFINFSYVSNAALIFPIMKDNGTNQYVTHIHQGSTPSVLPIDLVVDLGGSLLWIDCESAGHVFLSYRPARCNSIQCSTANANKCNKFCTTCGLVAKNTITGMIMNGEVGEDIITVQSITTATVDRYLLSCAPSMLLQGLAKGAKGMVGLGKSRISLPSQLAGVFGSNRKFSICLPSSTSPNGVMFFDTSPLIRTFPNTLAAEVSKSMVYTPLITKAMNKGAISDEYYIGVKSIRINGRELSINKSLLSINEDGIGGTKLSTTVPYTTLETSVYDTVTKAFTQVATSILFNMTRVAAIAPFEFCFGSENIAKTEFGSVVVPVIDLVLQSNMVKWRIYGTNSMVQVNDKVMCLGFLDGGFDVRRDSIVLGGYQLENKLLEFDLASSRMGFTSLLKRGIECSNFNLLGDSF
ncbi:hypothetical protein AQUCO_13500006v1 [Aquilegia coerulea]|uniref:Peptidase A1 domain-containing protein n=1 Tax=Aquilegia coerulea TaxID=218851 RepID=A0A2G5C161_AQUCA|nr:hypothetical protein AQUCO_13500006v1 [Aquilegia coerulea]